MEGTPEFLGPEWGEVVPFALREEDLTLHERDGYDYWVYHDPGPTPDDRRAAVGETTSGPSPWWPSGRPTWILRTAK